MSETKDDGGPAFPIGDGKDICWDKNSEKYHLKFPGMSLRDWYAGMALQGICQGLSDERMLDMANGFRGAAVPAQVAYIFADAMLKERQKK